jgi:DNA-binding Lrp family transcriptional regulator
MYSNLESWKITNAQLSKVGLSPAPTLERVKKKIRDLGIIESYHAQSSTATGWLGYDVRSDFFKIHRKQ